jgi:hypothetical protein
VVVELIGNVLDLLLGNDTNTSNVCNFPLRDAGLEPNELPVSFINKYIYSPEIQAYPAIIIAH